MTMRLLNACRLAMVAAAALAALGMAPAHAEFPEKPIRYILHASPGGGTDLMVRHLAAGLEQKFGWKVVVENLSGGRTAKQMAVLTRAEPDGYTIGSVTASGIGVWNTALKQYRVDDLEWVVRVVQEPYVIAVNAKSEFKTLKELLDFMKANPGKASLAGAIGRGSADHIMWEMLAEAAGVPSANVNYTSFDSQREAATQLVGGHVTTNINFVDILKAHADAGSVRILAVFADERVPALPDVPTAKEAGVDVFTGWQQFRGIIAPKGTPLEIQEKIATSVKAVMETPDFQKYLDSAQLQAGYMGPKEFKAFAKKQDELTKEWLKRLGMN